LVASFGGNGVDEAGEVGGVDWGVGGVGEGDVEDCGECEEGEIIQNSKVKIQK
jgi:hypothetical protein